MCPAPSIPAELPDDIHALKTMIRQQQEREKRLQEQLNEQKGRYQEQLDAQKRGYQEQLDRLQEAINQLLQRQYGPSSEKAPDEQMRLFNEPEQLADEAEQAIDVPAHQRGRGKRKPLPDHLPRLEMVHDLSDEEKQCRCGRQLTPIGEEVSEQLDIVPAKIRVIRNIRRRYACKGCEETVRTAALPPQPIPKSNATAGLLAHITVAKYQDALPLARQEKMFRRIGADIPRATLAGWMIKVGVLVQPLINLLREQLLAYDVMGMDETPVQVLKEAGRRPSSQSYIWVQRGGPPDKPVVLFHYDPSRGQSVAKELLTDYRGHLQTDGYEVYEAIAGARPEIHLVGCFAHARRKFFEADKAQGKRGSSGKAKMGLSMIQKLYGIEQSVRDQAPEERHRQRQERARPVLEKLRVWAEKSLDEVLPSSLTGKALAYLLGQWPKLIGYLEDGRIPIDNNATERAIRPFVIGRRNWLFSDTPKGAAASANLYSLIETAKANGLEPYHYLRHVFKELPATDSVEKIEALLPFNLDHGILEDPYRQG